MERCRRIKHKFLPNFYYFIYCCFSIFFLLYFISPLWTIWIWCVCLSKMHYHDSCSTTCYYYDRNGEGTHDICIFLFLFQFTLLCKNVISTHKSHVNKIEAEKKLDVITGHVECGSIAKGTNDILLEVGHLRRQNEKKTVIVPDVLAEVFPEENSEKNRVESWSVRIQTKT